MNRAKELFNEFLIFLNLMSLEEKKRNSKMVIKIKEILKGLKKWCVIDPITEKEIKEMENVYNPRNICYGTSYPHPMDINSGFFLF